MIDINAKFKRMAEQRAEQERRARDAEKRKLAKQMANARLVESFMNIYQLEKTGLCAEFVAQYYENKVQELGAEKVEKLKSQAAEYIRMLKSSGQIYENISWFRFVMNNAR